MSAIATPETETVIGSQLAQPWNVIIHNDPVNLMSYVAHVIRKIFGYPEKKAKELMIQVHEQGRCIAWSGAREQAEHYVRELHSYQLLATLQKAD